MDMVGGPATCRASASTPTIMNLGLSGTFDDTYIPHDDEVVQMRALLSRKLTEVSKLDARLAELERQRKALLDERGSLSDEAEKIRGLVSLVRRGQIPDEILGEIFVHCLPTEHEAVMHSREPPILLTRVCSSWRRIAFATPRLWASIHIPIPFMPQAPIPNDPPDLDIYPPTPTDLASLPQDELMKVMTTMNRRVPVVTEWLERSKGCPITVAMISHDFNGYNPFCELMLRTILPFRSRWEKLSIRAMKHHLKPLEEVSADETPLLRSFDFEETPRDINLPPIEVNSSSHPLNAILASESLRYLTLKRTTQDINRFSIPWRNLLTLVLHDNLLQNDIFVVVRVLQQCHQLEVCDVSLQWFPSDFGNPNITTTYSSTPVTLPRLKYLSIIVRGEANFPRAFDSLITPNLRDLQFNWSCTNGTPLRSLLVHSGQTLRKLWTTASCCAEDDFLAAIRLAPYITQYHIPMTYTFLTPHTTEYGRGIDTTDRFLLLISTPDEQGEILLPKIEHFDCRSNTVLFSDDAVLQFIHTKQAGTIPGLSKLKSISIRFMRPQRIPMLEELKPYVDDGLSVKFWYMEPFGGPPLPSAYAFAVPQFGYPMVGDQPPTTELF